MSNAEIRMFEDFLEGKYLEEVETFLENSIFSAS